MFGNPCKRAYFFYGIVVNVRRCSPGLLHGCCTQSVLGNTRTCALLCLQLSGLTQVGSYYLRPYATSPSSPSSLRRSRSSFKALPSSWRARSRETPRLFPMVVKLWECPSNPVRPERTARSRSGRAANASASRYRASLHATASNGSSAEGSGSSSSNSYAPSSNWASSETTGRRAHRASSSSSSDQLQASLGYVGNRSL